jgi:prophage DNA circulation protein
MIPTRPVVALALTASALAATGCGVSNPYDNRPPAAAALTAAPTGTASTSATSAPVIKAAAAAPVTSADQAIRRFASTFINWDFAHLAAVRSRLVGQSTGDLAAQMRKSADQALTESSRRVSNQGNEGIVEVINDPKNNGHFLVVTHETAELGDARAQSAYMVYRATATKIDDTYKLTSFEAVS